MVLKRKVTGIVLAGVLAVAAAAPLGLSASAADNKDVTVSYVADALQPSGVTDYYVTVPSGVTFTGVETKSMDVTLNPSAGTVLAQDLQVEVKVYSQNSYKMTGDAGEIPYTLKYSTTSGNFAQSTTLVNTGSTKEEASATSLIAGTYLEATQTTFYGQAEVTDDSAAANVDAGATSQDVLTYYVEQI